MNARDPARKVVSFFSRMDYFIQESERLLFRRLTEEDIPRWTDFFVGNPNLPYLGLDLSLGKEELAASWIHRQLERYQTQNLGHLAAVLKDSGEFIGMGGILPQDLNGRGEHEIAYSLLPAHWENGYATEIAMHMKKYGMESIRTDRLVSVIDIRNERSIHVARKIGMHVLYRTPFLGLTVDVYGVEVNPMAYRVRVKPLKH